jgi:hypothetical protein
MPKDIKVSAGLYSSAISSAYYNGYFDKMSEDGLSLFGTNTLYINPNVLPKIYEYGIEVNGSTYQTNLQIPLLPQEEKTIYIEKYIEPESSTFNASGLISDIEKYYGKYGTENNSKLPYNHEMYIEGDVSTYFPFNLLTDKVYNNSNGNIIYKDFDNANIEFSFLPSDKTEYISKIIIKNKCNEQTNRKSISPISAISSMIEVDSSTYDTILLGNVLKLSSVHSDTNDQFNQIYEQNKTVKYSVIGKSIDSNKYYITLDKIYPYVISNSSYIKSELYSSDIIHLNYLSIRGNPLIYKNGTYSSEDKYSIERYGEKKYSLKTGLFTLDYLNRLSNVMISEMKSVEYDSINKVFTYDKTQTKFVAEFSIDYYNIAIGDIIYISEDYYYGMVKEPFKIIKISRTGSTTSRQVKIKAISLNMIKKPFITKLEEIETSAISSISVLSPTDYLTDKTLLNTPYTNEFGEVYAPYSSSTKVVRKDGNNIYIDTGFIENISNIVACINDEYYTAISVSTEASEVMLTLLGDTSNIKIGDIVYIYVKSLSSTATKEITYTTAKASEKIYVQYKSNTIVEYADIKLYQSNTYSEAIAVTSAMSPIAIFRTDEDTILIKNDGKFTYPVDKTKFYTIIITLYYLDGTKYTDTKKCVYSPLSSIVI